MAHIAVDAPEGVDGRADQALHVFLPADVRVDGNRVPAGGLHVVGDLLRSPVRLAGHHPCAFAAEQQGLSRPSPEPDPVMATTLSWSLIAN